MDAILSAIASLDRSELVAFVISLDAAAGEWDVTLPLCDYFAKMRLTFEAEHRADNPGGCGNDDCKDGCAPQVEKKEGG
jgi:hypothetical protein